VSASVRPEFERSKPITESKLEQLHPSAIRGSEPVLALLARVAAERIALRRGMNRRIHPEEAWIADCSPRGLRLRTRNFEPTRSSHLYLNFALDGRAHFFRCALLERLADGELLAALPEAVHRADRRDDDREAAAPDPVVLRGPEGPAWAGRIVDQSGRGLGVSIAGAPPFAIGDPLQLEITGGALAGQRWHAELCHLRATATGVRVGLDLATAPRGPLSVRSLERAVTPTALDRVRQRSGLLKAGLRAAVDRALTAAGGAPRLPAIRIVDFENRAGESLRGILDANGETRGAPAVIIPPAWGRTKETLMPLALAVVAAFRQAGEPVVVLRFDGIRKRGESFRDPECRAPGRDHHRFSFTQGVRDIQTSMDFLERSPEFRSREFYLLSFSASSVEARRAARIDPRVKGWIAVVGTADCQSMMRVISGGLDYVRGNKLGIPFSYQEVLGVEVDMDYAAEDAKRERLSALEDSRADFAQIQVPITWFHGRHDAWMDPERVKDALSRGDTSRRRFIEIPTGHMLKSSQEAIETFQLAACELGRMVLGRELRPALPDLSLVERRGRAERARLPREAGDVRQFWKDYLVGRDETLGIELMTSITPYEELMQEQLRQLALRPGARVADVGSGTGALALHLAQRPSAPLPLQIVALDFVRAGHLRARERLAGVAAPAELALDCVEADLDLAGARRIPLADAALDAALASLFLSYVRAPDLLLRELRRVLRPGGRLVLSSLRRDADMSRLYTEGVLELKAGRSAQVLGQPVDEEVVERAARAYLNQASRLLDLEESGRFRFYDGEELSALVRRAGFRVLGVAKAMGDPAQAVIVAAERS